MKDVTIVMTFRGSVPENITLGELRAYAEGQIYDFFRFYDEERDEEYDFERDDVEITDKGLTILLG